MRGAFAAAVGSALAAAFVLQCGSDGGANDESVPLPERGEGGDDGGALEATVVDQDAFAGPCSPQKPFGAATPLPGTWDPALPYATPRLSADELTIYFTTHGDAGANAALARATRASRSAAFGAPEILTALGSALGDYDPSVSADHLSIWFRSDRSGNPDLWTANRTSTAVDFGPPTSIAVVNTAAGEAHAYYRQSASELWFVSNRPGAAGYDVYVAVLDGGTFGAPAPVTALESAGDDFTPQPSEDGLDVLFASSRDGGMGGVDLYLARRTAIAAPFAIAPITELNTATNEQAGWLSADRCRIYFSSDRGGTTRLYEASRPQ